MFNFTEVVIAVPRTGAFVASLEAMDVNRDGKLDLVFGWVGDYVVDPNGYAIGDYVPINIMFNIGGGQFVDATSSIFPIAVPSTLITNLSFVGDFNGDGFVDLYMPDGGPETGDWPGGPGTLLLATPDGGLVDGASFLSGVSAVTGSMAVGDIDGDNDDDVIMTLSGGTDHLHVIVSDPSSGMAVDDSRLPFVSYDIADPANIYGFPSSFSVALLDADGDGDLDLVLPTTYPGNIPNPSLLLFNDGTGHFGYGPNDSSVLPFVLANHHDTIVNLRAVDVDGDGDQDLIATCLDANNYQENPLIAVYANDGLGGFTVSTTFQSNSTGLDLADLNNDGYVDIMCGDNLSRSFFLNDGTGNFIQISDPTGQPGRLVRLSAADLNGDGLTDMFAWSFDNGQVTVWYGQDQPSTQVGDNLANDLIGDGDDDALSGLGGNDVIFGGGGKDRLEGGIGADYLNGGAGDDLIYGGDGNDTLMGWLGLDKMYGGLGNDTYLVTDADDEVYELVGEGKDEVRSSVGYTLGANLENLLLTGSAGINGTGNTLANIITGNGGNNVLTGLAGDDILRGGLGNDTLDGGVGVDKMYGGVGDDTYIVSDATDYTYEYAGEGTDLVLASVTTRLRDFVENLTLTGSGNIYGTGNDLANVITGNAGSNRLYGLDGDDTLYGLAGNDTLYGGVGTDHLYGGIGNDVYSVGDAGDIVHENGGEGTDTVYSFITYTLTANVERLYLVGSEAIDATGNSGANILKGNEADNVLSGGDGNDLLYGYGGNDTLVGGAGVDKMYGREGDDTYIVSDSTDFAYEAAGQGTDTVLASVTCVLRDHVEVLTLTGTDAINGYGNGQANILTGNDAANLLAARAGDDQLSGLGGDDILYGEDGNDLIAGGAGRDRAYGGSGSDTFIFADGDFGGADAATADIIHDFSQSEGDHIDLSAVDANTGLGGNQAFSFIGSAAFSNVAGQLRTEVISGNTYVMGDTDGDGTADFWIRLDGLHTLNQGDFIL